MREMRWFKRVIALKMMRKNQGNDCIPFRTRIFFAEILGRIIGTSNYIKFALNEYEYIKKKNERTLRKNI